MSMQRDFPEVMSQYADHTLAAILTTQRDQYQAEALAAAQEEFEKRNLNLADYVVPRNTAEEPSAYRIRETTVPELRITASASDYEEARKSQAQKDMLYGAMWCIGGIVATAADIGFIFWGAIVFGAVQFFKGVSNS